MGTSSSYGGPKNNTPLIPSWLDDVIDTPGASNNTKDNGQNNEVAQEINLPPLPPAETGHRFRGPRSNFSKYLNSQGRDTMSLKNSFQGYVGSSLGGSKNAAIRMGSSRKVAGRILGLFSSIQNNGYETTLSNYNLREYLNKPIKETLLKLIELVCLSDIPGANLDEAIARRAAVEALMDLNKEKINIDTLEQDTAFLKYLMQTFITKSIKNRLLEDLGKNIIISPENKSNLKSIEMNLESYIKNCTSKGMQKEFNQTGSISNTQIQKTIMSIYGKAYKFLEQFGE